MSILHRVVRDDASPAAMKYHELAAIFPMMTDEEQQALTADIKEHGQRDPIVTFEGKILDGRNRHRACMTLGFTPKFIEWNGVGSAQAFVVSHNLHRRHLTTEQRAFIGAELVTLRTGQRSDFKKKTSQGGEKTTPVISTQEAADLMKVSRSTISEVQTILKEGTEEEIKAAKAGAIGVGTLARRIRAEMPPTERLKKNPEPFKARTESFQANARLWRELREALEKITGLPRPSDLVPIVRSHDRSKITDTKLLPAIQWLMEFSDAWTSPDAEANSGGKNKPARKAKEADASQGAAGSADKDGGALREARGSGERGNGSRREDHADA